MFFLIMFLLLALVAFIVYRVFKRAKRKALNREASNDYRRGRNEWGPQQYGLAARVAAIVTVVFLGLATLIAVFSTFYTLDEGEAAVIVSFDGTLKSSEVSPGLKTKAPWDRTVKYDIRNQTINFEGSEARGAEGGSINLAALNGQTSDGATATFSVTVRYSITPDHDTIRGIYRAYQTQENMLIRLAVPGTTSTIRNVPPLYTASTFRSDRATAGATMLKFLEDKFEDEGINIDDVDLKEISYRDDIEQSLSDIQKSQARVEQARADLETSYIEAERVKTEAQAQSDADQIVRCGATSTTDTRMIGGREQRVTVVTPIPNEDCEERLNEQVLTTRYIDMLSSAAAAGNTVFVVPPDHQALLNLSNSHPVPQ